MSESTVTTDAHTKERALLLKLVSRLDPDDDGFHDDIGTRIDRVADRIERVEHAVADNATDIEDVHARLAGAAYDDLTPQEKELKLARALETKARRYDGKAAMTYDEVLAVFDHDPAPGTAYNLMERVGRDTGFNYEDGPNGKRVTVDAERTHDVFNAE